MRINKMKSLLLVAVLTTLVSATYTTDLTISTCNSSGCTPAKKRIALDVTSNHTSPTGEELINVQNDTLTMTYGGPEVGGPRVYLIEEDGTNKNYMFMLKNQEFTFDVELSTMPCGFNAALYFVGMPENEGGAETGTKYCDAQAVAGTFCSEMDIMEANTKAQQYTTHGCIDTCGSFNDSDEKCQGTPGQQKTTCDQSGCGLNPFRYGPGTTYNDEYNNSVWYGEGAGFKLDSTKKYTVVTQFATDDKTASGTLSEIYRFYVQDGNRIELPTLYVKTPTDGQHMGGLTEPTTTEEFCTYIYDRWNGEEGDSPLAQMGKNMDGGMVLAMSAWYAQETYVGGRPLGTQTGMSWLDGLNDWGKLIKAGPCDSDTSDSGTHHASFSDIRVGDIGTTVPGLPPRPSPPTPPPKPKGGQCCYNGCNSGNCQGGWCGQSEANCTGNCNGQWCPSTVEEMLKMPTS